VDVLAHLERRLEIERQSRDNTESPEPDHARQETRSVLAGERDQLSVRAHEFDAGDRGGQVAVAFAGPVRPGGARAGDRDVRQRAQVVQRVTGGVQVLGEFAVAQAGRNPYLPTIAVDLDGSGEGGHRHEIAVSVRDAVKRVAGAECAYERTCRDDVLHL